MGFDPRTAEHERVATIAARSSCSKSRETSIWKSIAAKHFSAPIIRCAGHLRRGIQLASNCSILWHHSPGRSAVAVLAGAAVAPGWRPVDALPPAMDKFRGHPFRGTKGGPSGSGAPDVWPGAAGPWGGGAAEELPPPACGIPVGMDPLP